MKTSHALICLSALLELLFTGDASAAGVLLTKKYPGQTGEFWTPLEFTNIQPFTASVTITSKANGRKLVIQNSEVGIVIDFPDLAKMSVVTDQDIVSLRTTKDTLMKQAGQYKAASGILSRVARDLDVAIQSCSSGNVLVTGKWMSKSAYDAVLANASAAAKAGSIPELVVRGQTFKNVRVTSVSGDRVGIMHDGGVGSLNFTELTADAAQALKGSFPKQFSGIAANSPDSVPPRPSPVTVLGNVTKAKQASDAPRSTLGGPASPQVSSPTKAQTGSKEGTLATDSPSKAIASPTTTKPASEAAHTGRLSSTQRPTSLSAEPVQPPDPSSQPLDRVSDPTPPQTAPSHRNLDSNWRGVAGGVSGLIAICFGVMAVRQTRNRKKVRVHQADESKFNCPVCGQRISAAPEMAGQAAVCPSCSTPFVVPAPLTGLTKSPRPSVLSKWALPSAAAICVIGGLVLSAPQISHLFSGYPRTPEALVRRYLGASDWRERLAYVREPSEVEPLMKENYAAYQGPPHVKSVTPAWTRSDGTILVDVAFEESDQTHTYWIDATSEGLKIDWKASKGYNRLSLPAFVAQRPTTHTRFRMLCKIADYYNFEFSDPQQWLSIALEDSGGMRGPYGYVRRDSESGRKLYDLLKDGDWGAMILDLAFPNSRGQGNVVEITKFVCAGWIEPPADAAHKDENPARSNKAPIAANSSDLPEGAATDAEFYDGDLRALDMFRTVGFAQGFTWAQQHGRVPTTAEYQEVLAASPLNRFSAETLAKDAKEARANRRMVHEFENAFQQGCKAALELKLELNRPAF